MSDRDEINNTPLPPTEIHPVYVAHVLLCHLIETEKATRSRLTQLHDEMQQQGQEAVMSGDVDTAVFAAGKALLQGADTLAAILAGDQK
jgi:hypothetical protein